MTQREKRDLIRSLKKEIKAQMPIILDSIKCDTMTPEQIAYFRSGVGKGRRGSETEMLPPKLIGEAIDVAIECLTKIVEQQ